MNMFGNFNNKTQGSGGHQEIKKWDVSEGPMKNIEEKFWDESFYLLPLRWLYSFLPNDSIHC